MNNENKVTNSRNYKTPKFVRINLKPSTRQSMGCYNCGEDGIHC